MNVRFGACMFASFLALSACGSKDKDDDDGTTTKTSKTKDTATAAPASTPSQVPTTTVKIDDGKPPTPAGIEARVKQELDNRSDGVTGTSLTGSGAKATVQAPKDWKVTKGAFTLANSGDEKARISVGGGDQTKLEEAAKAAGLTGCQWAAAEPVTVGKDKLAAQAADGFCSRGAGQVKAAFMVAEGLLVLGAWDPDGDATSVFGSMRAAAKAAAGGGDGVSACCQALRQNAKSAPPQQQGAYLAAAGACDALRSNPQGSQMLGQVRALLLGAGVPAQCR